MIVGLGNPGPTYANTRHNIGFMVAARFADRWGIPLKRQLCDSTVGEGTAAAQPVRVVLPETFMNDSGKAVGCLLRRWRLEPSSFLVVCDDVSLPVGMIRLRSQGSAGGHNGLSSILEAIQTEHLPRLRVGIRTQKVKAGEDLTQFVLGRFLPSEKKSLEEGLAGALEVCDAWLTRGITAAMNLFNKKRTD